VGLSTVHMQREQWRDPMKKKKKKKKKKKGKGKKACLRWLTVLLATVAVATTLLVVAGGTVACGASSSSSPSSVFFFPFLLLLSLFSALFFFAFFLSVFLLSFALLCSLFYSLFPFALSSPVFIGKKQGRERPGGHCAATPPSPLQHVESFRQVGGPWSASFWCFSEEKSRWKQGEEKSSSSPSSRVQGKKKTHSAVQNGNVSGFFFFNSVWNDAVLDRIL